MLKYEVTIIIPDNEKILKLYSSKKYWKKTLTGPLELKKNIKPKLMKITGSIKQKFKKDEIIFWFLPEIYNIKLNKKPKVIDIAVAINACKKVNFITFVKDNNLKSQKGSV